MEEQYAVMMQDITKRFGDFCALDQVNLSIRKGSIHAILGENGAGKTTLMNILYGLYHSDSGKISIYGKKQELRTPKDAIELGIGMVHQHFMLVENYTVLQNIILGDEKVGFLGKIDYKTARKELEQLIKEYNFHVDLNQKVQDITVGMQQRVEIIKALYRGAEILILDEPTSVLTPQEIDELLEIMKNMVAHGKTVVIITHKLVEIMNAADYCTVIRKGQNVSEVKISESSEQNLAELMVGHAVNFSVEKKPYQPGEMLLEICDLVVEDDRKIVKVNGLTLELRAGEILGLAGVDGNGQQELFEAIASLRKTKSGSVKIRGKEIQNSSPKNMIASGITVIPEDRQKSGLVMDFTVAENLVLENVGNAPYSKYGLLNWKEIYSHASKLTAEYDVRPEHSEKIRAGALSGGNQQKAIIAREISNDGDVLIAIQPTRGLDVGAIEFVHKVIVDQRDKGKGVLLISLELDEVLKLSDRVAVIYNGKIQGILQANEADELRVGVLMAGGEHH